MRTPGRQITKECQECLERFHCVRSDAKFCGTSCRSKVSDRNHRPNYLVIRAIVDNIKTTAGCADCGYDSYACALQFDHVRGTKEFDIGHFSRNTRNLEKVLAEVEKCDIVCANCHAVRTATRGGWLRG